MIAAALAAVLGGGPAPSIAIALEAVCLPFVRGARPESEVARMQRLRRRVELHLLDGPHWNGHGYDGFRNVPNIRLNSEQVLLMPGVLSRRSCSFEARASSTEVDDEVKDFIKRDGGRFVEAPDEFDALTAPTSGTRLFCSRLRPGSWIVTSGSTVAMGVAPPSSAMCQSR